MDIERQWNKTFFYEKMDAPVFSGWLNQNVKSGSLDALDPPPVTDSGDFHENAYSVAIRWKELQLV